MGNKKSHTNGLSIPQAALVLIRREIRRLEREYRAMIRENPLLPLDDYDAALKQVTVIGTLRKIERGLCEEMMN